MILSAVKYLRQNDMKLPSRSQLKQPRRLASLSLLVWLTLAAAYIAPPQAHAQADTNCAGLTAPLVLSTAGGAMPDMAIDSQGRAHIVWQGADYYLWYAQVGPDGTITIPATNLYSTVRTAFPRIAVDAAGDAHIITTRTYPTTLIYLKMSGRNRVLLTAFTIYPLGTAFDTEDAYWPSIDIDPVTQLPVIAADWRISRREVLQQHFCDGAGRCREPEPLLPLEPVLHQQHLIP